VNDEKLRLRCFKKEAEGKKENHASHLFHAKKGGQNDRDHIAQRGEMVSRALRRTLEKASAHTQKSGEDELSPVSKSATKQEVKRPA